MSEEDKSAFKVLADQHNDALEESRRAAVTSLDEPKLADSDNSTEPEIPEEPYLFKYL